MTACRYGVRRNEEARYIREGRVILAFRWQGRIACAGTLEPEARGRSAGLEHARGKGPQDARRLACLLYVRVLPLSFCSLNDVLGLGNGILSSAASLICLLPLRTSDCANTF
jgi:hypothetical protein